MRMTNATSAGDTNGCVVADGKAVWFTYSNADDGLVVVDTCGSSFATALGVYTNSCGSLARVTCGTESRIVAGLQACSLAGKGGTTYHILAGGYDSLGSGTLQITACLGPRRSEERRVGKERTNGVP